MDGSYHYIESGLDTVFLANGFKFLPVKDGEQVVIDNIDGLHRAIGIALASQNHKLSGKEIRFLRTEMLLSQANLARILGVKELTIIRWEKNDPSINRAAEGLLRCLYFDSVSENHSIKALLNKLADLDNEIHLNLMMGKTENSENWENKTLLDNAA
ncbi:MAG: hypothetical protein ABI230_09655 [Aestuariivirga sp.]